MISSWIVSVILWSALNLLQWIGMTHESKSYNPPMIEYEWPNPPEVSCTFNISVCVCVCDAHVCNSVCWGHSTTLASFSMLPLWASSTAWRAASRLIWISSHKPPNPPVSTFPTLGLESTCPHMTLYSHVSWGLTWVLTLAQQALSWALSQLPLFHS